MYAFLTALLLFLSSAPALAQDCCCCGGGGSPTPTDSGTNEETLWRLYDGDGSLAFGLPDPPATTPTKSSSQQAGVTCRYYNEAANLGWKNNGGDWVDADNVPQGEKAWATAAVPKTTNYPVTFNVTSMLKVKGFIIRQTGGYPLTMASRENVTSAYRPKLTVTLSDASIVEYEPTADTGMSASATGCSTSKGLGKSQSLSLGTAAVMQFPVLPSNAVAATLRVFVLNSAGSTNLRLFAMSVPYTPIAPVTAGFSSAYPNDVGLKDDSRVKYFEGWDEDLPNWWARAGMDKPSQTNLSDGLFPKPSWSGVHIANGVGSFAAPGSGILMPRTLGRYGNGLSYIMHDNKLAAGAEVPSAIMTRLGFPNEAEELYLRYWWKAEDNFKDFAYCEGGKLPGMAGSNATGANSGVPANGLNGWTLRYSFSLICDPNNPAYGRVNSYVYAYHADMKGLNGDGWHMGELGLLKRNQWYCIEQHIRVNTPGVRDGLMRSWVNGRLSYTKENLYLRDVKPPGIGYGRWQLVTPSKPCRRTGVIDPATGGYKLCPECAKFTGIDGRQFCLSGETNPTPQLGINRGVWGKVHNGGKNDTGVNAKATIDQTVVATERIGCGNFPE